VKQAIHACDCMGLFLKYETGLKNRNKSKALYNTAVADLATAHIAQADADVIEALKTAKLGHLADVKAAEKERVDAAEGFFSLYANLLSVEAHVARDKVVSRRSIQPPGWT
jgi:hypothetical protein